MASRPRLRTRTGCTTCRLRKVKCDETRPICNNCRRTARICSFQPRSKTQLTVLAQDVELRKKLTDADETTLTLRTRTFNMSLQLPPGIPEQAYPILEFYCNNNSAFCNTADDRPSSTFISLLPFASRNQEVMLSLLTLLSVFMPESWTERTVTSLRLANSAAVTLRKSLVQIADSCATNEMILAAGLLHLYELHNRSSDGANFAHLSAVGFMLKSAMESPGSSSTLPTGSMESYAYHAIVSSTCNHHLFSPKATVHFAEEYMLRLANLRNVSLDNMRVLGVCAHTLVRISKISLLRRQVLADEVSLNTFEAVKHELSLIQRTSASAAVLSKQHTTESLALEGIYILACQIFATVVLSKASEFGIIANSNSMTVDEELFSVEFTKHMSDIEIICAQRYPFHTAIWPLFVIGLAARTACMGRYCEPISNYLQRHVDYCMFGMTLQARNILMNAWETSQGPSLLMAPWLATALMF